jgi:hypothetical protein
LARALKAHQVQPGTSLSGQVLTWLQSIGRRSYSDVALFGLEDLSDA